MVEYSICALLFDFVLMSSPSSMSVKKLHKSVHSGRQLAAFASAESSTWRSGKVCGKYPAWPFCNSCGVADLRHGPEYDCQGRQVKSL